MPRPELTSGKITVDEFELAKTLWNTYVQKKHFSDLLSSLKSGHPSCFQLQLGVFLDSKGVLCCAGRFEVPENMRNSFPILLPCKERYTELQILHAHERVKHMRTSATLAEL